MEIPSTPKSFGLSNKEVVFLRTKYGYNEIPPKKDYPILRILISQFSSFLVLILLIAGTISIFINELIDGLAIFSILVINAIIGFFQEYKAENAVKALNKLVIPHTIVLREGQEKQISVRELVPGDIIILNEGDKIPADSQIIEAFSLKVDESMLTGESLPVSKFASKNKEGQLFKGTLIVTGRTKAIVTSIGKQTEFGKIIELVSRQEETASPLTLQLNTLGKRLSTLIFFLIAILIFLGYLREIPLIEMLMTAIALGVSAIPEGLPIIVTLTLAMGVSVLARKKAITRKMNAIETLGATSVICSDKTGTLTLNEMTVKKVSAGFKETLVPGIGYKIGKKDKINLVSAEEKKLLEICENCNNSYVDKNILGDPTEIALKILTRKANYIKTYKELDENIFTSQRKMMSTLNKVNNNQEILAKGAFEEIIKKCTHIYKDGKIQKITTKDKKEYQKIAENYAREALRVLAFAFKKHKSKFDEQDLVFVGLVGMLDPPRKTVASSIAIALQAGIKLKIITGDNAITAKAIGEKIGLPIRKVINGDEIDKLSDSELKKLIYETDIFARTSPKHKFRIVNILKKQKEVVAVTGDGVNDAPALKHADVGIAMGIKGTEATKEVADIVLKDDNFTTIVNAIEEGRRIYQNILSFIKYMLSANFDSIMTVGILTILGYPLPILPLQILWVNLATDALPALALGASKAEPGLMSKPPHPKQERILKKFIVFILIAVAFQVIANLIVYFYGINQDIIANINTENVNIASHARTMVFSEVVLFELVLVFFCNETTKLKAIFSNKKLISAVLISFALQLIMIYVPFMNQVFKTTPLNLTEWLLLGGLALSALFVPPLTKLFRKIFSK